MANNDKDLVLYLPLDDIQSGGKVQDASDFANHGDVIGNVALVPDDTFGGCLSLNVPKPVGDHVIVTVKGLPMGNQAHTIEGWIYANGLPTGRSWPLLLGQVGKGSHHWLLHWDGTTNLGMWLGTGFSPKIDTEKWTHIAMVHDGKQLSCYVNGTLQGTPKNATFNLTSANLIIARGEKRGGEPRGEFDFSGKIANLRIYKRPLSQAEIQRDINVDKMSLVAFRKSHPIDFRAYDDDEQPVLYISDDTEDRNLNLELHNTSTQAIQFNNGQNAAASVDNHHFALRFRPGTLSDSALKSLINPQERAKILKQADQWDLYFPSNLPAANETASLYLLYKGAAKSFQPDERRALTLQRMSAAPASGARGTQVELIPRQLTAAGGDATPITGSRSQYVHITNQRGKKNIPLHVGFINGNTVLNDGKSSNTLRLRITNASKDSAITLNSKSSSAPSKFIISFDIQNQGQSKEWALVSSTDSKNVRVSVGQSVINPEGIEGETPEWPITFNEPVSLTAANSIQVDMTEIVSSLPSGHANLYVRYENIPGYWDGQFVCQVEKGPIVTDKGNVGIGTANPTWRFDVKSDTPIKLGLEGRGGGQLVINNDPDDNKIYLEAFSSDGKGTASELALTGRHLFPVPKLTLKADTTEIKGNLSISGDLSLTQWSKVTFPPGCTVKGIPIIAMKKISLSGAASIEEYGAGKLIEAYRSSSWAAFDAKVSSAQAIISLAKIEEMEHVDNNLLFSEEQRVTITQIRDYTVYFDALFKRAYKTSGLIIPHRLEFDVLVIAVLATPGPGE